VKWRSDFSKPNRGVYEGLKGKGPEPLSEAGLGKQDRHLGREFVGRSLRRMRSCVLLGLKFKGLTGAQVQWEKRGTNKLRESIG